MSDRPPPRVYAAVTVLSAGFVVFFVGVVSAGWLVPAGPVTPRAVIAPLTAMAALTAVVFVLMFAFRNIAVLVGKSSVRYYKAYDKALAPAEWIERPARLFANLFEVPVLFYVLCVLVLVTGEIDGLQLALAWLFVAMRLAHAAIFLAVNFVPVRMMFYVYGWVALIAMWWRFAG
jgi:hypothetical protein